MLWPKKNKSWSKSVALTVLVFKSFPIHITLKWLFQYLPYRVPCKCYSHICLQYFPLVTLLHSFTISLFALGDAQPILSVVPIMLSFHSGLMRSDPKSSSRCQHISKLSHECKPTRPTFFSVGERGIFETFPQAFFHRWLRKPEHRLASNYTINHYVCVDPL